MSVVGLKNCVGLFYRESQFLVSVYGLIFRRRANIILTYLGAAGIASNSLSRPWKAPEVSIASPEFENVVEKSSVMYQAEAGAACL